VDTAFSVDVQVIAPGQSLVAVAGELDLATAARLEEALIALPPGDLVLIDLAACEFIDSTGMATIVRTQQRQEDGGGHLAVFGASDQVARILEVVGLTEDWLVFATREEALARLLSS
jgi:anti-anti-sigma factor